jgi:DNA helicase-2/ATP-dependent DNA helicase PcrA
MILAMNYNEQQQTIINSVQGAYLVSAPVGTGKTTVLVGRVLSALESGIPSEAILCLTFTNKAAEEMRSRLSVKLDKTDYDNLTISTFHGFCSAFIRAEAKALGLEPDWSIIDEEDQLRLMKSAMLELTGTTESGLDTQAVYKLLDRLYQEETRDSLASAGVQIKLPDQHQRLSVSDRNLGRRYAEILAEQHLIDFNGLVLLTLRALYTDETLLAKWSQRFQLVQLDEFQDTHLSEYLVVKQLARVHKNIALIGDLDQTIYAWRGSDPEKIVKLFSDHFAPVVQLTLSVNYRSPQTLITAFGNILDSLTHRHTQSMTGAKSNTDRHIRILSAYNYAEEASMVSDRLHDLSLTNPQASCAVLVRNRFQMTDIISALTRKGIPFLTVDQYDFFRRQEIRDLLAYVKIIFNKYDLDSAYRLVERPARQIGSVTINNIRNEGLDCGLRLCDFLELKNFQLLEPFANLLKAWNSDRIIVLDTETTGFSAERDEIIQVYAREIIKGKLGAEFHRYLRPTKSVGSSYEVHKLSDEFLASDGEDAGLVMKELFDFIGSSIIVGHNVRFDRDMIIGHGSRLGLEFKLTQFYDTLDLARRLIISENYKLGHLAKLLNLATATHSADDDVEATIGLLEYLIERLKSGVAKRETLFKKYSKKFYLLANLINAWQEDALKLRPAELLLKVWSESGLAEYYQADSVLDRQSNVQLLVRLFQERDQSNQSPATALKELISFSALTKNIDFMGLEQGKVPVITIHQAKGLEFDQVFIMGLNQGRFPRYNDENIEEQKRLFYVAATRAKEELYLSYANFDQYNKPLTRSVFVDYIDPKLITHPPVPNAVRSGG